MSQSFVTCLGFSLQIGGVVAAGVVCAASVIALAAIRHIKASNSKLRF
ncbi:hypothetical protein [Sulfitobacter sp. S190]|nr:hypothetical protein [Sulfitobacter sp. S190]UWR21208.1 hypothetical protein K3756_10815 [Sulfitobacter sp. S190]